MRRRALLALCAFALAAATGARAADVQAARDKNARVTAEQVSRAWDLFDAGAKAARSGNRLAALAALEAGLEILPGEVRIRILVANMLEAEGRDAQAAEHWQLAGAFAQSAEDRKHVAEASARLRASGIRLSDHRTEPVPPKIETVQPKTEPAPPPRRNFAMSSQDEPWAVVASLRGTHQRQGASLVVSVNEGFLRGVTAREHLVCSLQMGVSIVEGDFKWRVPHQSEPVAFNRSIGLGETAPLDHIVFTIPMPVDVPLDKARLTLTIHTGIRGVCDFNMYAHTDVGVLK